MPRKKMINDETKDLLVGAGKAGLSSILPVVAPLFFMIYDEVNDGEFKRRIKDFIKKTEDNFDMMRETLLCQLNQLKDNKLFTTVLAISGHLAVKTNDEKRTMLANAVANSTTTDLSEDEVIILLNSFEKYTLSHLCLLRFLSNPKEYPSNGDYYMVAPITLYYDYYPERKNDALYKIIVRDLYDEGMINVPSLNTSVMVDGAKSKCTTELGDKMIAFFGIEKFPQNNRL